MSKQRDQTSQPASEEEENNKEKYLASTSSHKGDHTSPLESALDVSALKTNVKSNEVSDSITKTKMVVTKFTSVPKLATHEPPADDDPASRTNSSSDRSNKCWKCSNCGALSKASETTDQTREPLEDHHNGSSSSRQTKTSPANLSNPQSTSENCSPTDPTNSDKRRSSSRSSKNEGAKPPVSSLTDEHSPSRSSPSDTGSGGLSSPESISKTVINSKTSTADSDYLTTNETDSSKLPHTSSRRKSDETNEVKHHVSEDHRLDQPRQPQTASNLRGKTADHQLDSSTSDKELEQRRSVRSAASSKKQLESDAPSRTSNSSMVENNKEKQSTHPHSLQRSISYPTTSSIDDQRSSKPPLADQSKEIVTHKKQLNNAEGDKTHIAYIPHLAPNGPTDQELETTIRQFLKHEHQLNVLYVRCSSQFDLGIVGLQTKEDKDKLVNTIRQTAVKAKSDRPMLFLAELELVSYVVVQSKEMNDLSSADDIARQWAQHYEGTYPSKCEQLSLDFPNIFRVVTNTAEKLITAGPVSELNIENQKATVYCRADCCFFEGLPPDISANDLYSAISEAIPQVDLSKTRKFISVKRTQCIAVVLICNVFEKWNSINLNGQVFMKKDKLTYSLRLLAVSSYISISSIRTDEIFAGTVLKSTSLGEDIIVELSSKSVYDKCLEQRELHVGNHVINITSNSVSSKAGNDDINASNWYETEMTDGKSNIMAFITQPDHRIFRLKWNSEAFLEQFNGQSAEDNHHVDNKCDRETTKNRNRHLLRMTVMLNTIGIVGKGSYCVNDKKIQLKTDRLTTIVYNHQSRLQRGMTVPTVPGIDYPYRSTTVQVINEDCLIVYEQLVSQGYRPLLLNMANAVSPGGGYRKGDGAQEENVFRRSNYYRSLDMALDGGQSTERLYCTPKCETELLARHQTMYPIDRFGAIYTSGLTVFRHTEGMGYALMEKPIFDVCAIAVAAYRDPKLHDKNLLSSKYSIGMRKKIETIFAVAKHHNHDCLILSAFGCGAFRNPPKHVATIFKSVIEQYAGFFKRICFAIIDDHNTGTDLNPQGNYRPFQEILDCLDVKPIRDTITDMMIGPWRILNSANDQEICLSDVSICPTPLCHYGGTCRDLGNKQHCREYLHPPLCSLLASAHVCPLKNDYNHMLWFTHRTDHSHGAVSPSNDITHEHMRSNREASNDDNVKIKYDAPGKNRATDDRRSHLPLCPWTPFYCRQHTSLSESTDIRSLPLDTQNHCREFRHVCRFGGQCHQVSNLHWETTIHIAREMCPNGNKCSKMVQENHMNSFSHPGIADIRRLCAFTSHECQDRRKQEHLARYRHRGNHDRSSVIPYRGLNNRINFIQNQQEMITAVQNYAEHLRIKTPVSIAPSILKCIRELSPVHQCSKAMFELILALGYVMSSEHIKQLTNTDMLIQTIQQSKHIYKIVEQHKNQRVEKHINQYIHAIVSAECSRRSDRPQMKTSKIQVTTSSYLQTSVANEDHNDTIRKEEKLLRSMLTHEEIDIIRLSTMKITEASLNLPTNPVSIDQVAQKYITTVFGPHLCDNGGDIVLIFKREVMYHPDANFSIQSMNSFVNGKACSDRPWSKNSDTPNGRLKQFHGSQLHCSILGYDYAAAGELLATIGQTKKTMDIDLAAVLRYMSNAHSDQLFEGHLPERIPLDYIEEVYIPHTLFTSLTSAAQMTARTIFHSSLHMTSGETNRYYDSVNDKLIQKLIETTDQQLSIRGSVITLPPSYFKEYVTLPLTLAQACDQDRQIHKQDSISDSIYIYWQSMYGDMMMVLSSEPIDSTEEQQHMRSLICYIAAMPSTTTSDYQESSSYLNSGDPLQHATVIDQRSFLASSATFHRGCNVDDYLTYCLKLEKSTGQVTLSHAGPNSIYNYETISYKFSKSILDLNELNYIQISAHSHQVPIRDCVVCFHPLFDLHPSSEKNFHRTSTASKEPRASNSVSSHSPTASNDHKSPSILPTVVNAIGGNNHPDVHPKKLSSCPDSSNCLLQASRDHCKKYSHPCRFSELCRNKDKEPHLTHEPHRVDKCLFDQSCIRLDDPYHRAMCRHTNLPDFLIPCRDQSTCYNRASEHRTKYSHGEKITRMTAAAVKKPQETPSGGSVRSSESDRSEQQKKTSYHGSHDEKPPCRHGSNCYDQSDSRHCLQYSHPPEQRAKSSVGGDYSQTSHRLNAADHQSNSSSSHDSSYLYSDIQRPQPRVTHHQQTIPCPASSGCRDYSEAHRLKYSHASK